jgi:transcriptional regulator with XRE-family HTH domain
VRGFVGFEFRLEHLDLRRLIVVLGLCHLTPRTVAAISQIELAARIKTSQGSIVRLEKGPSTPTTRTLQRIAKATGHELTITFSRKVKSLNLTHPGDSVTRYLKF